MYEITFIGLNHTNPYTDVDLSIIFTNNNNGFSFTSYGFWDGENIWKVRINPKYIGTWSYITSSNDSLLNNVSGTIDISEINEFNKFITVDTSQKYMYRTNDGLPKYLLGDTNWNSMSSRNGTLSYSVFQQIIDIRSTQKFNYIRSYICAIYAISSDSSHANEGGYAFNPWNPDNLNPLYYQEADKRIAYANSKGMIMHLLFGSDGNNMTNFFGWNNGKMERYIKYCCARYGAYNISWEGRAEYTEQTNTPGYIALANQIGNWVEQFDPHNHIQSMHPGGNRSNNELGNELWLDWIMHQARNWPLITSDRSYNKPVMNEEFYYENSGAGASQTHHVDANTLRKGAWNVMTYGASGLAYGNTGTYNSRGEPFVGTQYLTSLGTDYMTYLYEFWSNIDYWNFTPNNGLITSGTGSVTANIGNEYAVYLPLGGTININLSSLSGLLYLKWFNPRTGTYLPEQQTQIGNTSITAPDTNDWVAYISPSSCPQPTCTFIVQ